MDSNDFPIMRAWAEAHKIPIAIGVALGFALLSSSFLGHSTDSSLILWATALLIGGAVFYGQRAEPSADRALTVKDVFMVAGLLLVLAPFYLAFLRDFPTRINADEIITMDIQRNWLSSPSDPLNLSPIFFYYPRLFFIAEARLAQVFGGVTLVNMRAISALLGLGTIPFAYLFFRSAFSRFQAFFGAAILGFSHTHWILSRMAVWNVTAIFTEMIGLSLAVMAFRRRCPWISFLAGIGLGLTFYSYPVARLSLVIVAFIGYFELIPNERKIRLARPMGLGFILCALPIILATLFAGRAASNYTRSQLLIFKEGREQQMGWTYSKTMQPAIVKNITGGLFAFNSRMWDMGNTYPNLWTDKTGIVDPLTGALLWIGIILILRRRKPAQGGQALGVAVSFLFLWLFFSFVMNKAPCYPRLLIMLPLAVYLTLIVLTVVGATAKTYWPVGIRISDPRQMTIVLGAIAIVFWNIRIAGHVMQVGMDRGDEWGDTVRYILNRQTVSRYSYFMVGNKDIPYYYWGYAYWHTWAGFFVPSHQSFSIIDPSALSALAPKPPFTLFMNNAVLHKDGGAFLHGYTNYTVNPILPDGALVAVEVQAGGPLLARAGDVRIDSAQFRAYLAMLPHEQVSKAGSAHGRRLLLEKFLDEKLLIQAAQQRRLDQGDDYQNALRRFRTMYLIDALRREDPQAVGGMTQAVREGLEDHESGPTSAKIQISINEPLLDSMIISQP